MKYTFENTHLITGYIKELLKDFNLPSYPIYKDNMAINPGRHYIKDGSIVVGNKDKTFTEERYYIENEYIPNATRNLIIKSNRYDSYTHEYLGDFLRYIRDYKGINLMPLYNCFSNVKINNNTFTFNNEITSEQSFTIDSNNSDFIYYLVPVKFDSSYTISLDCNIPYELSCILYTGPESSKLSKLVSKNTYSKINGSTRNNPYLYTISSEGLPENYWRYEKNLKLVVKLPSYIKTQISILEGDYTLGLDFNNIYYNCICSRDGKNKPDLKYLLDNNLNLDRFTRLSLLTNKSENSFPFSDRLVEYLLGQAITTEESIPDNVGRIQTKVYNDINNPSKFKGIYDIFDNNLKSRIYEISRYREFKTKNENILSSKNILGKVNSLKETSSGIEVIPDVVTKYSLADTQDDLLYYIDKDIESVMERL